MSGRRDRGRERRRKSPVRSMNRSHSRRRHQSPSSFRGPSGSPGRRSRSPARFGGRRSRSPSRPRGEIDEWNDPIRKLEHRRRHPSRHPSLEMEGRNDIMIDARNDYMREMMQMEASRQHPVDEWKDPVREMEHRRRHPSRYREMEREPSHGRGFSGHSHERERRYSVEEYARDYYQGRRGNRSMSPKRMNDGDLINFNDSIYADMNREALLRYQYEMMSTGNVNESGFMNYMHGMTPNFESFDERRYMQMLEEQYREQLACMTEEQRRYMDRLQQQYREFMEQQMLKVESGGFMEQMHDQYRSQMEFMNVDQERRMEYIRNNERLSPGRDGRMNRSPDRKPRSTRRDSRSPDRRTNRSLRGFSGSPRRNVRSPARNERSPRRNSRSPRRSARSPRRNARSPRRNARSPRRNARSRDRKVRSPHHDKKLNDLERSRTRKEYDKNEQFTNNDREKRKAQSSMDRTERNFEKSTKKSLEKNRNPEGYVDYLTDLNSVRNVPELTLRPRRKLSGAQRRNLLKAVVIARGDTWIRNPRKRPDYVEKFPPIMDVNYMNMTTDSHTVNQNEFNDFFRGKPQNDKNLNKSKPGPSKSVSGKSVDFFSLCKEIENKMTCKKKGKSKKMIRMEQRRREKELRQQAKKNDSKSKTGKSPGKLTKTGRLPGVVTRAAAEKGANPHLVTEVAPKDVESEIASTGYVLMAIVKQNHPKESFTKQEANELKKIITIRITKTVGELPKFSSTAYRDGGISFTTKNLFTVKWLQNITKEISPFRGASLICGLYSKLIKQTRIMMWIPKNTFDGTPEEIVQILQVQNEWLDTSYWTVVSNYEAKEVKNVQVLVIKVDHNSLEQLEQNKLKVHLGLHQIKVRVLGMQKAKPNLSDNSGHAAPENDADNRKNLNQKNLLNINLENAQEHTSSNTNFKTQPNSNLSGLAGSKIEANNQNFNAMGNFNYFNNSQEIASSNINFNAKSSTYNTNTSINSAANDFKRGNFSGMTEKNPNNKFTDFQHSKVQNQNIKFEPRNSQAIPSQNLNFYAKSANNFTDNAIFNSVNNTTSGFKKDFFSETGKQDAKFTNFQNMQGLNSGTAAPTPVLPPFTNNANTKVYNTFTPARNNFSVFISQNPTGTSEFSAGNNSYGGSSNNGNSLTGSFSNTNTIENFSQNLAGSGSNVRNFSNIGAPSIPLIHGDHRDFPGLTADEYRITLSAVGYDRVKLENLYKMWVKNNFSLN